MSPIILGRAKSLLFAKWFTDSFCLYKSDKYEPKSFDFNSFLTAIPCLPYSWNLKPITEKSRLSSIFVTQEKNDLDQLFSMQKFFIHRRNVLARRFFVLLLFIVC